MRTALASTIGGVTACLVACAPARARTPKSELPPLDTTRLTALAKGPGAQWAVLIRPRALYESELAPAIDEVLPKVGVDRLSTNLALDLRRVPEALFVGYADGTFYAARVPRGASPSAPIEAFERRLLPPTGRSSPRPDVVRAWGSLPAGGLGSAAALWSTRGDVVLGEGGKLEPVTVAIAIASGRLALQWSLDEQAPFDALARWAGGAPLMILARCPLDTLMKAGAHAGAQSPIVTQECEGAALTATSVGSGRVRLSLHLRGAWGSDAPHAANEVRAALANVMQSDLGRALGLRNAPAPEVTADARAIDATMTVNAGKLADGIHRLVAAEVREAVDATR